MSNRLAAIGIDVAGEAEIAEAVEQLLPAARETIYRGGGSLFEWRDASGAGLMVTTVTVDNVVRCVAPTFTSLSRLTARPTGFGNPPHCRFCEPLLVDVLDDDGAAAYSIAVHLEDAALTRRHIPMDQPVTLAVAAFAERARSWTSEAGYAEAQAAGRGPAFPSRSVVALGGTAGGHDPHAMVTGTVVAAEVRENESTGVAFRWTRLETDGGTIELVGTLDVVPEVAPGHVVQALCWLVARVTEGLSPHPLRRVRWK